LPDASCLLSGRILKLNPPGDPGPLSAWYNASAILGGKTVLERDPIGFAGMPWISHRVAASGRYGSRLVKPSPRLPLP
jgi:hypothetical protein